MTIADKLTFSRIICAPLFFIFCTLPRFFPALFSGSAGWTIPVLWLIFIGSEITDMLDGMVARKRNEVSSLGKLFDPFADTFMQLTCFFSFVLLDILHPVLFLLVMYREFGILFIRNLMLKKGTAMGARMSGKIKTVVYIIAAAAALVALSFQRLVVFDNMYRWFKNGAQVIFLISVVFAIVSFFDYVTLYRKTKKPEAD